MSQFNKIDDNFAVSPQLPAEAMEIAAKEGFHAIICNRPDDEDAGQPTLDEMSKAATRAGLAYHAVPFDMRTLDRGVIDAFEAAVASAEGPVLAYCRSGTRSTIALCVIQRRAGKSMDDILSAAHAAGYDLSAQAPMIEALV